MDGKRNVGAISKLVLLKLGFDLRQSQDAILDKPLTPRQQTLADRLMGYAFWRDVTSKPPRDKP